MFTKNTAAKHAAAEQSCNPCKKSQKNKYPAYKVNVRCVIYQCRYNFGRLPDGFIFYQKVPQVSGIVEKHPSLNDQRKTKQHPMISMIFGMCVSNFYIL
jgi:hypothetical protein